MGKKESNPSPTFKKPPAPSPPPMRTFRQGLFGFKETKESKKLTEEWWIYVNNFNPAPTTQKIDAK